MHSDLIQAFSEIDKIGISLVSDNNWPAIIEPIISSLDQEYQLQAWKDVDQEFLKRQRLTNSTFHKGEIYFRMAASELTLGLPVEAIISLGKAEKEDRRTTPGQLKAAEIMLANLRPIFYRYSNQSRRYQLSRDVLRYYNQMSSEDKKEFANIFISAHDLSVSSQLYYIKEGYFGFISDPEKRDVFKRTYDELREAALTGRGVYLSLYGVGPAVEVMLDDLFERDDQKIWKIFKRCVPPEKVKPGTKLASTNYDDGMNYSEKMTLVKLMAESNCSPIPPRTVLQLILISEYRDLTHARRQQRMDFNPSKFTILALLYMIASIAGHWWPANVNATIEHTLPLVSLSCRERIIRFFRILWSK